MSLTRREFVKRSALASAALGFPMVASRRVLGANDQILMGVVGLGGRGVGAHIPGFAGQKGVVVVAVSDPDTNRMAGAAAMVEAKYKSKADQYQDMRKMFERKDLHCIANATQNYWHGLSTIWACQAGKHVYCEKPLSHYIWEGRQMVNAARKYDRIVQCGTQHRSESRNAKIIEWLRAGNLGKIKCITAFANKPRTTCGKRDTPLEIPASIDYDLWCGPARKEPIYRDRLQYDCSFFWNTGGGESVNQGVHEVDVARWVLGTDELPRKVLSIGGRFVFNDACDAPNTQIIYYDFAEAPILYEVHNLRKAKGSKEAPTFRGDRTGVVVDCEGGSVNMYRGVAWDKQGKEVQTFSGVEDHFVNFINAVRAGDRKVLTADVEVGHLSTRICHVGNISYRVGSPAPVQQQRAAVKDTPLFAEMYDRYLEHLKGHEIDPNTSTLGLWLECDNKNECFKDHTEANKLVKGSYRAPYAVPDLSS